MSFNVLVVEDEPKVLRFVAKALEQAGMHVEALHDLSEMQSYLERSPFDVLVLDRLVGNRDSLSVLEHIKKHFPNVKILILSALGELDDRVSGLEHGADDYLKKPFHVAELLARVRTLGRRTQPAEGVSNTLRYADLEIQMDTQTAVRGGKTLSLTAKEFKLLSMLAKKPNRIFSKTELLDRVWGINADPGSNVVEVTLNRLRSKVDPEGCANLIHTRRGSGYWLGENALDE